MLLFTLISTTLKTSYYFEKPSGFKFQVLSDLNSLESSSVLSHRPEEERDDQNQGPELNTRSGTHLGWQSGRPPGVSAQFPFLPDNLTGRSCPTKQDLPDPRYDPQAVAQPLGSLEDKALYGLVLCLLSLSGLPARVNTDEETSHGQREEKLRKRREIILIIFVWCLVSANKK